MDNNIELIFGANINPQLKEEYTDILFYKYIAPKIETFKEVSEELFDFFRKKGTKFKLKWYDRKGDIFYIRLFKHGPWFLIKDPSNTSIYGKNDLKSNNSIYYELPMNFIIKQFLETEKGLLNDNAR